MLQQLFIFITFFSSISYAVQQPDDDIHQSAMGAAKQITVPHPSMTPFIAEYTTEWKLGWFSIDIDAKRTLKKISGNRWQLIFQVKTGAAKLEESSEFTLSPTKRLQPLDYQYRASGLFNEGDRTLSFRTSDKSVLDKEKNITYPKVWQHEIQDNLTYMLQAGMDLAAGKTEFTYPVFEKNQSKDFRFKVIGKERLKTKAGMLDTIKVQQIRKGKDREVYAWFAKDKNYLLVRLLDKKKGKKRYEINVTNIDMQE